MNGVHALTTSLPDNVPLSSLEISLVSAVSDCFGCQNLKNTIKASKLTIAEETLTSSGPTKFKKINCVTAKPPPETMIAGNVSLIPLNPSTINTIRNAIITVTRHKINDVFLPSVKASKSVNVAGTVTGIPIAP